MSTLQSLELNEKMIEPSRIQTAPGSEISKRWITVVNTASLDGEIPVAVKTIRPYRVPTLSTTLSAGVLSEQDIIREMYIWRKLSHPNILPFMGFNLTLSSDATIDSASLVSPFMSNGNFIEYLSKLPLGPIHRLGLVIDVAQGLDYLHNLQPPICHGDIGAHNVVISADHRALLCDFSVAKLIGDNGMGKSTINSLTENPMAIRYMSPELVASDSPETTLESEMWAWGCLALVAFTGQMPFKSLRSDANIVLNIARGRLPAALDELEIPTRVRHLLEDCWQMVPERRPTARQVLEYLIAIRNSPPEEEAAESSHAAAKARLDKTLKALQKYHIRVEKICCDDRPFAGGGFGSVYRAILEDGLDRREVAVKKLEFPLDKEPLRIKICLARELSIWEGLAHTNILPLVGFVLDDDNCWLVSPYIPGGNIQNYLDTKRPLYPQRLALALDTAEGLEYLHRSEPKKPPICHGDIKMSNVLVTLVEGRPRALLCDFGLARVVDYYSGFTTTGFNTSGTQIYFSPELVLEDEPYRTLESDIWAWGCLLYQ
ncbi:hypothetical protein FRB99_001572, partial [Tulasnella sp. 403]